MQLKFEDRREAGAYLAEQLGAYADDPNVLVLALPRGGVPVGYEVARKLRAPLDVFTVRKLGVPGHEEYAMGAIASGGVRVLNDYAIEQLNISQEEIEAVIADEMEELERRERVYRDGRPAPDIEGKTVLLVDDGMATGSSMAAAIKALRLHNPGKVVVAVPTASRRTSEEFEPFVDDIVCAITPEPFMAVGVWYERFEQTTDDEVRALLREAQSFGRAPERKAGHEDQRA